jgi:hypothetical protein
MNSAESQGHSSASDLWREYVDAEVRYNLARARFVAASRQQRHELLTSALEHGGPSERHAALQLLRARPESERIAALPALVRVASHEQGLALLVRDVIGSISRRRMVENIEQYSDPLLESGGWEEYRRLAELFITLDAGLLSRLVRRAAQSRDPDIREVADDFCDRVREAPSAA